MCPDMRQMISKVLGAWKVILSAVVTVVALVAYVVFSGDEQHSDPESGEIPSASPLPAAEEDPPNVVAKKTALERTIRKFVEYYYTIDGSLEEIDYRGRLDGYVTSGFLESYAVGPVTPQAQAYADGGWQVKGSADAKSFHAELPPDMSYAHAHIEVRIRTINPDGSLVDDNVFDVELTVLMTEDGWRVDQLP